MCTKKLKLLKSFRRLEKNRKGLIMLKDVENRKLVSRCQIASGLSRPLGFPSVNKIRVSRRKNDAYDALRLHFTGKVAESFVIYHLHGNRERCIKAIPPRTVRLEDCKSYDNHFRWRWTENGQVQNVKTGLCLELNDYDVIHHQYSTLYLGTCNYRKGLQVIYRNPCRAYNF